MPNYQNFPAPLRPAAGGRRRPRGHREGSFRPDRPAAPRLRGAADQHERRRDLRGVGPLGGPDRGREAGQGGKRRGRPQADEPDQDRGGQYSLRTADRHPSPQARGGWGHPRPALQRQRRREHGCVLQDPRAAPRRARRRELQRRHRGHRHTGQRPPRDLQRPHHRGRPGRLPPGGDQQWSDRCRADGSRQRRPQSRELQWRDRRAPAEGRAVLGRRRDLERQRPQRLPRRGGQAGKHSRLKGEVNGGGSRLYIRTSNGSVNIRSL